MKLTRRHLLYASLSGAVAAAGGFAWSKRPLLRVPHGWVGYTEKPVVELFPSEVGLLTDADKDVLWELMNGLARLWDMDPGIKASFVRLVDLKTNIAPSYLAEYQSAVKRFTELRKASSPEKAARILLLGQKDSDEAAVHARVHVMQEFVVRLLVSGGFRKFSLGKWRGYSGGPRGYRLSQRARARLR